MRLTASAFGMVVGIIVISLILSWLGNLLTVDSDISRYPEEFQYGPPRNKWIMPEYDTGPAPGNTPNHIIWFLQVTDLHLSLFQDHKRTDQLKEWCADTVSAIKPAVVLASGDLTDAKTDDLQGSRQILQEWRTYSQILEDTKVQQYTKWLDIRGNHDNFNLLSFDSINNYYRKYSVQGKEHSKSYMHQVHSKDGDVYSFIAVDACLEPGPRRPFNFIGFISKDEFTKLEDFELRSRNSNGTIWFGHYPTSSILSSRPRFKSLMRNGLAYLCGHFHTLYGVVPHMYARQMEGFLELELADWKDNRMYRVAAIDHGMLSFTDVKFKKWPVVLVTNPKHALFQSSLSEPIHRIAKSTHVRVLAFSRSNIASVQIKIDNGDWQHCRHSGTGPLYVLAWDPFEYSTGVHYLEVYVKDDEDNEHVHKQPFVLDNTKLGFDLLPRILLMFSWVRLMQFFGLLALLNATMPLVLLRSLNYLVKLGKINRPRPAWKFLQRLQRQFWLTATVDRIFVPLMLLDFYVPLGPWFVGEFVDDYLGVCTMWGIIIDGNYLPGGFTYAFGWIHLLTFNVPVTMCICRLVEYRYVEITSLNRPEHHRSNKLRLAWHVLTYHLPLLIFILLNFMLSYAMSVAYGGWAFIISPLKTWSGIVVCWLWYCACNLPESCFDSAKAVYPQLHSHSIDLNDLHGRNSISYSDVRRGSAMVNFDSTRQRPSIQASVSTGNAGTLLNGLD